MITEFGFFEPKLSICDGHYLEFKRESVSVMKDFLLTFPQNCICSGTSFFWQHHSVPVIGNYHPVRKAATGLSLFAKEHNMKINLFCKAIV